MVVDDPGARVLSNPLLEHLLQNASHQAAIANNAIATPSLGGTSHVVIQNLVSLGRRTVLRCHSLLSLAS